MLRRSNARETRCGSLSRARFNNTAGSITGSTQRPASVVGTARFRQSIPRCCWPVFCLFDNASRPTRRLFGWRQRSTNAWISAGCSTAIRYFSPTAGNPRLVFSNRVGTPTAKTRFFTCSRSLRRRTRSRRVPGMPCGATAIVTKATVTSRRSVCRCLCISTRTPGSIIATVVKAGATVSTIFKTQLPLRSRIARSA